MQTFRLRLIRQGFIALLMIATLALTTTAKARKLYPVDEGPKDASFKAFRDKLIEAVKQQQHAVCSLGSPSQSSTQFWRALWSKGLPRNVETR